MSGARARRVLAAVDAIAGSLAVLPPGARDPSLAGGDAGLAVLFAWLAAAGHSEDAAPLARRHLDAAIDAVARDPLPVSLWEGFTGVAWAAEHVDRLLGSDGEDRNEAIDDALAQMLSHPGAWPVAHDLVEGVTGAGVYALERYPRPAARRCLEHVVDRLEESARHDRHGTYWWTAPSELVDPDMRAEYPSGLADLGVAHGVPGAVALLGAIHAAGIEPERTRRLLDEAIRWLTAHSVPTGTGPTFPFWVAPGEEPAPARSAWCYGDPGVAAALLVAARAVGEPGWEREAVALACRAAARAPEHTGVVDAGFCHGAAGLAHLYNRLHQATGEPVLAQAARDWLERTLDLCDRARRRGGASWVEGGPEDWQGPWTGVDVVDGAAGIALVLLAAATPVEPAWDRMFLVSAPRVAVTAAGTPA